ncbi:pentatricopeptide repeat-containing protein At1g26900, mitochondrial [Typha angustifolia]|uniref:pentatricopeptide repeat-containing protein At1g26900, mitochondrial n=1 Tax=Typha angustifolia TaxID=59011 RepID=UPI003C2D6B84
MPTIPILLSKLLKSCTKSSHLHQLHAQMIKSGLDHLPFPASKLLAAAALLDFHYARSIFYAIQNPNLFQYNTMLRAFSVFQGDPRATLQEAIDLFNSLRTKKEEVYVDQFSFISILKVSALNLAVQVGRQIHGSILKSGFEVYIDLRNTLIHLYCICGRICDGHKLFDEMPHLRDAVSWGTLVSGYLRVSEMDKVVNLFKEMRSCGLEINAASLVSALVASGDAESLHGYCIKAGFCSDLNVATAIVTMYMKSRCLVDARKLFGVMRRRDLVLYNSMVDGYAKEGLIEESLALVEEMRLEGVEPNSSTFAGLLSACASSGALLIGRRIHGYIREKSLKLDIFLGTALLNMYSKNGCLDEAIEVFDQMPDRDVKAWTAMIMGYGVHGQAEAALQLFYEMEQEGLIPNEVTFLAVLSACSHGGLVTEGKECFDRMVRQYGLHPKVEHYGCLIDLLGRAGMLKEAYELMKNIAVGGDAMAWRALLAACRVHGNAILGELVRSHLVALGDEHPTDSILLSNTYALEGRWADIAQMRELEEEKVTGKKEAGCSSIVIAC